MEPIDSLAAGIKHVISAIDEAALEPDPARTDWERLDERVDIVRRGVDDAILAPLDAALEAAGDDELRARMRERVAEILSAAAALLHASGDEEGAAKLRERAAAISVGEEHRGELLAADRDTGSWVRLEHARWLLRHRRADQATRVAKAVARAATEPAIRDAARRIIRAPKPITGAPPLFRINGCGVGLYGEHDPAPDGWYVSTLCVCLVFVPVLPLAAYRVRKVGQGSYQFIAKEALSPFARACQVLVGAVAAIAVALGGVTSYLDSPSHKAAVALERAEAAEARGDRQSALEGYTSVMREHGESRQAEHAAEAVVRIAAAAVPEPCTAESVDKVAKVVDAYRAMPSEPRAAVASSLGGRLVAWADEIGTAGAGQINAALTVLDLAAKVAEPGPHADVDARRGRLRRALAEMVGEARPLRALALYVAPPVDPASIAPAAAIVEGLDPGPSLWIEAEPDVVAWATQAEKRPAMAEAARRARARIAAAHEAHAADVPLLESGDEKQIAAALARSPRDQELAAALAQIQRRRGDVKAAIATLGALGPPGRMTAAAQQLLAMCRAEDGDLAGGDAILSDLLTERLPAFQEAQRDLEAAADERQAALVADAKAGRIDDDIKRRIEAAAEADRPSLFRAWLGQRLRDDPLLKSLQAEFLRHEAVVPASLALGQIKLRRAAAAAREARRALLAEAEKIFLSIHQQAEGDPSYHLGLGQVYHRLGRADEGNAELSRLLERKNPELTLNVANVYRDLGLPVRAKEIAEDLYRTAPEDRYKHTAASLLSHLVAEIGLGEDEEEAWLKRSDATQPEVKHLLLRLEARRLARQGKLAEADRAYARLAADYERDAGHDAVAANNAAVTYQDRYTTTGDPAHLRAAVKQLEAAHRLSPQSAMVAGNLANALEQLAEVTVLDRWVKTRSLALDSGETEIVLSAILAGPLREQALADIHRDPSFQRSLDVGAEEQVLAPGSAGAYSRQVRWLVRSDDDKALVEMQRRLAAMPSFDAASLAESRRAFRDRAHDAMNKAMIAERVARAEERVQRVERAGHAPTLSAANLVLSVERGWLTMLDRSPGNVDAMVETARKAAEGWPEGGADRGLPGTLFRAAIFRAVSEEMAMAKAVEADGRDYSDAMLVARALNGPESAAVLSALRRRPELAEAARLCRLHVRERPGISDVVLARVAGDAELEAAASASFDRASLGAELAIDAILAAAQPTEAYTLEFWRTRGARR